MYLVDLWTDEKLSLQRLHDDWLEFKKEDPVNHAETFKREFSRSWTLPYVGAMTMTLKD